MLQFALMCAVTVYTPYALSVVEDLTAAVPSWLAAAVQQQVEGNTTRGDQVSCMTCKPTMDA